MSRRCLIGHTGFVGSNLLGQTSFDDLFRSHDIESIGGRHYDLLVCSGAPAAKWKANQDPDQDWSNLQRLISALRQTTADRAILISTVDVFGNPDGAYEDTPVDASVSQPYGLHRHRLELHFQQIFPSAQIVRLPGLFGHGLRKNFIFDLLQNPDALSLTHADSQFQFYNLDRLWHDVRQILDYKLPLVHLSAEPVSAAEVALRSFDRLFENRPSRPPVRYDMRSRYARLLAGRDDYFATAAETFAQIRNFALAHAGVPA